MPGPNLDTRKTDEDDGEHPYKGRTESQTQGEIGYGRCDHRVDDTLEGRTVGRLDREYFAEWLSRTLAERGIAGGEVARALDVNDSAISRWRNGKASPGLDSVMALAQYLDVNPIALAVTAGLMDSKAVGVERLPLPAQKKAQAMAEGQIMKIRGIDDETRKALIQTLRERYSE